MATSEVTGPAAGHGPQRETGNPFEPIVEGLATALQWYGDILEEKLASLSREQSMLLMMLEAARDALPSPPVRCTREREPTQMDDDVDYINTIMTQAPWYTHRVRLLSIQKTSLAGRIADLQRRTAGLRESLPVQVQRHEADRMARWRSELAAFQEQGDMAFAVCYPGGVAIRSAPSVEAPCVGDVLHGNETFWASERLGRLGEDTIYVKLRDRPGWVFENLNGTKVLSRITPSSMEPPPVPSGPSKALRTGVEEDDAVDGVASSRASVTHLEIPRGEEGRFSQEGSLGWGPGSDNVGVIFRDDVVGYLPSTISEQVLPFLHSPGLLRFSFGAWREAGETVARVELHVTPLLPESEMDQQHAKAVRKLHHESRRVDSQLNSEYQRRRKCQQFAAVQVPVEILCNIMGRFEWRDLYGDVRLVARTWRTAANIVAPLDSCRRRVAQALMKTESYSFALESVSQIPTNQLGTQSQIPPPSQEESSQTDSSLAADKKLRFPPAEWFQRSGFEERSTEDVLHRLEDRLGVLGAIADREEREERRNRSDDQDVAEEGAKRVQWRRIRFHLCAVRKVATAVGLLGSDAQRTVLRQMRPRPPRKRVFGVVPSNDTEVVKEDAVTATVAAAVTEDATATGTEEEDGRWNGWKAFSLVILLASSEDRPFLCRWALQFFGDYSIGDTLGLPKAQMLELLCWYYLSLPAPKKTQENNASTGFQSASNVAINEKWDGPGSFRLRMDLVACICALEKYFLRSDVFLTPEQQAVVDTDVQGGQILKVIAFAGTGKTTCLRAWAEKRPYLRILYVAFNKSVSEDARKRFPHNVYCRTMNSVAYQEMGGSRYKSNEGQFICRVSELKLFLEKNNPKPGGNIRGVDAGAVLDTLNRYWNSKDDGISEKHVKFTDAKGAPPPVWVLGSAQQVWARMKVLPRLLRPSERLQMTHSGLLKMFQLEQKRRPSLKASFDVIMLDEAQDSNDCMVDIVLKQAANGCGVILVGDPHQMIYGFRGARDQITKTRSDKTLNITQVFRFGPSIAAVANTVIEILKGETLPLLGSLAYSKGGPPEVLSGRERQNWLKQDAEAKGRYAYIASTNASLILAAIEAKARGETWAFVGGKESVKMEDVYDLCTMIAGDRRRRVSNPQLREIGSIGNLMEQIEGAGEEDPDLNSLAAKLRMIDMLMEGGYTPEEIVEMVTDVEKMAKSIDYPGPLMMLSTVHKAKGSEFDTVVLADDFKKSFNREKANQLYVGITRARKRLLLNYSFANEMRKLQMWDSLSLRGDWSDPLCVDANVACSTCPPDEGHAQNPQENNSGGSDDRRRFLFMGSGSNKPIRLECARGHAFPYMSELLPGYIFGESGPAALVA